MKTKKQTYTCRYGCGYYANAPQPRGKHEHDKHGKVWSAANGAPPSATLPAPEPIQYPTRPATYTDATRPMDLMKQALEQLHAREKKLTLDLQVLEAFQTLLADTRKQILILSDALNRMTGETAKPAAEAPEKTATATQ